jgi:outer membrane immunogenic protein
MGLLTGRVGYAWDRLLVYGKGGAAWVHDTYARGFGIPTAGFPAGTFFAQSQNNTVSGWTLGAGVEYAFAPNWVAGIEYDYLQFGTHTFFFSNNAVANSLGFTPFNEHIKQNVQMLTARLSFLFSIGPGFVLTR